MRIDWGMFIEILVTLMTATLVAGGLIGLIVVDLELWWRVNPVISIICAIVETFLILVALNIKRK